jgi:hypothetical protein
MTTKEFEILLQLAGLRRGDDFLRDGKIEYLPLSYEDSQGNYHPVKCGLPRYQVLLTRLDTFEVICEMLQVKPMWDTVFHIYGTHTWAWRMVNLRGATGIPKELRDELAGSLQVR